MPPPSGLPPHHWGPLPVAVFPPLGPEALTLGDGPELLDPRISEVMVLADAPPEEGEAPILSNLQGEDGEERQLSCDEGAAVEVSAGSARAMALRLARGRGDLAVVPRWRWREAKAAERWRWLFPWPRARLPQRRSGNVRVPQPEGPSLSRGLPKRRRWRLHLEPPASRFAVWARRPPVCGGPWRPLWLPGRRRRRRPRARPQGQRRSSRARLRRRRWPPLRRRWRAPALHPLLPTPVPRGLLSLAGAVCGTRVHRYGGTVWGYPGALDLTYSWNMV